VKYLITGFPGTGKSTIAKALQEKGLKTYDIETMDGYTHLTNRKTGEPISLPKNPERGWFDKIGRVDFDLPKVNKLLDIDQDVFIFMLMDNQQDHYELFDKIFLLTVDDDTLLNRLNSRKDNCATTSTKNF
jgi:broad-specificity NMP kinase